MRIIAAVTLIFLPGTFVATVFSTGMFDWGNGDPNANPSDVVSDEGGDGGGGRTVSRYIWVYFMMTGILTFLVLAAWILFSWVQNRKMARRFGLDVEGSGEMGFEGNGKRRDTETSAETVTEGRRLVREGSILGQFERWMDEARATLSWWGKTTKEGMREEFKSA
jgi:hypothetical protein